MFVSYIEKWSIKYAPSIVDERYDEKKLNNLRKGWLSGVGIRKLLEKVPKCNEICKDFYGYKIPWIIHAVSQQLNRNEESERTNALDKIALLVELGVPNELAAKIFLAGVRSREAATELSKYEILNGTTLNDIKNNLESDFIVDWYLDQVSKSTSAWLTLLKNEKSRIKAIMPIFSPFKLDPANIYDTLYIRSVEDKLFLCNLDGSFKYSVESNEQFPFNSIANDPRFTFIKDVEVWKLHVRDPRLQNPQE